MADIASLGLEVDSSQIKAANVELRAMPQAASAAERAAAKLSGTTDKLAAANENLTKRAQATIRSLEFERAQLTRTAAEQQKFAALRKAGVAASSAEGAAIMASVTALQAQRAATERSSAVQAGMARASQATAGGFGMMARALAPLAAALSAAALAQAVWTAGMKVADLQEQAEQIGLSAEQLQAWRLAGAQAGVEAEQLDGMFVKLQRSMGTANDGNKEMIDKFKQLGVNILDANGKLRQASDVMPELAAGLLKVSSQTERNALMMEFLGKSGTKANTMLADFAKGSAAAVAAGKNLGAIASPETIKQWDELSDSLKVAGVVAGTLMATLGGPAAGAASGILDGIAKSLGNVTVALNNLPKDATLWDRLNALFGGSGYRPMGVDPAQLAEARARQAEEELKRRQATGRGGTPGTRNLAAEVAALQAAETAAKLDQARAAELARLTGTEGAPGASAPSAGVGSPTPKATGGGSKSDPFRSALESGREYILTQQAAAAALGKSAFEASRLKHETELLNKAQGEGKVVTAAQKVEIAALAGEMAKADTALAGAKFMDDFIKKHQEFMAQQQIEQEVLLMSTEAAMAYRIEQEAINAAMREGITLSPERTAQIREMAAAQAAAAQKTAELTEWVELGKDVFKGFFTDIRSGLMEGKSAWEIFSTAAINALQKIADKLLEMATNELIGKLIGQIAGGLAGGISGTSGASALYGSPSSTPGSMSFGGPRQHGGPVSPGKAYLVGEHGPELFAPRQSGNVVPFSRGGQSIVITVAADSQWVRATARDESGRVVAQSAPAIVASAVEQSGREVVPRVERHQRQAGGEWRNG